MAAGRRAGRPRVASRAVARKILSEHYPRHIAENFDARIRAHFNIILPSERMRAGNGVW